MPIVDGKELSPQDAMAAGACPECGVKLEGLSVAVHREGHWPSDVRGLTLSKEAQERRQLMIDYEKRQ